MKRIIALSCLAGLLIAAGVVIAGASVQGWHACSRNGWGHWGAAAYLEHELNLSNTQKQQIQSMWQTEKPTVSGLVQEFAVENREMDQVETSGKLDESKVAEIAARQGATLSKLFVEKAHFEAKIYADVLNPAQRTKADKLQARWEDRLVQIGKGMEQSDGK
jgi:Spy/CpxP family protein refolding chaperone